MGNQVLCDVLIAVMLFYCGMCLFVIGRPSLAVRLSRWIGQVNPSFLSRAPLKARQKIAIGKQAQTR